MLFPLFLFSLLIGVHSKALFTDGSDETSSTATPTSTIPSSEETSPDSTQTFPPLPTTKLSFPEADKSFNDYKAVQKMYELEKMLKGNTLLQRVISLNLFAKTVEMPKSINNLLFNGNQSIETWQDVVELLKSQVKQWSDRAEQEDSGEQNDEFTSTNICIFKDNSDAKGPCEDLKATSKCFEDKSQNDQGYSQAVKTLVDFIQEEVCSGDPQRLAIEVAKDLKKCVEGTMLDSPKLYKWLRSELTDLIDLEESPDNQQTCSLLEKTISSPFKDMDPSCKESLKKLEPVLKPAVVAALTFISDGRLIEECPALYKNDA